MKKLLACLVVISILFLWRQGFLLQSVLKSNEIIQIPPAIQNNFLLNNSCVVPETNSYTHHVPVVRTTDIVQYNKTTTSISVCHITMQHMSRHFPHGMQQLYRCWSWFQQRQKTKNIIIIPADHPGFPSSKRKTPYYWVGISRALVDAFGVEFLSEAEADPSLLEQAAEIRLEFNVDYALYSPQHARTLRDGIVEYYFPNRQHQYGQQQAPRIAILNRAPSSHRSILNAHDLQISLEQNYNTTIPIAYFEGLTFLDQVEFLANVDILVSPHGAQLTSIPFLANCAAVLEIFPKGYSVPWFFGSLAAACQVDHYNLYLSNQTPELATKRGVARSVNLCPPIPRILEAVQEMVKTWKKCRELAK